MENAENNTLDIPESKAQNDALKEATIPTTLNQDIKIPIKFNKEERELSLEEASTLAQKGLKYDMVSPEYDKLRLLALKNKKSVGEFLSFMEDKLKEMRKAEILSKCSGNEEIADEFLNMEEKLNCDNGEMDELKEFFPEIENAEELPEEVTERAREKGSRLLDEYLRYLYSKQKLDKENEEKRKKVNKQTLGSLKTQDDKSVDPVRSMFLKGIWG